MLSFVYFVVGRVTISLVKLITIGQIYLTILLCAYYNYMCESLDLIGKAFL